MLSSELYYKVNSIDETNVSINGYNYLKVNVTIPGQITLTVYIGEKHVKNVKPGEYFYSPRAYLTSSYEDNPVDGAFSFRIDSVKESSEEDFVNENQTTVTFNARVSKRPKNTIKFMGPMKIPTYSVRAAVKNESGEPFHVLVVGFHSKAKLLDGLAPVTYSDVTGHISPPKKVGKSCVIVLKDLTLLKEVEAQ